MNLFLLMDWFLRENSCYRWAKEKDKLHHFTFVIINVEKTSTTGLKN